MQGTNGPERIETVVELGKPCRVAVVSTIYLRLMPD